jgi:hypothetical protein
MFRKLMLTGVLGIGTVAGLAGTPTAAEAAPACRVVRTERCVVYRHVNRHRGYRHVVVERPRVVVVNPCVR